MGDMALTCRTERFIEEFSTDIIEKYGLKADWVREQVVGEREAWHEVYLFVVAKAGEDDVELMLPYPLFFAADEDSKDAVERVMDLLDLDLSTANARMRRAELISDDE